MKNIWITQPKPNPSACLRLFCFPYAGGGALIYRDWPDHLPASVELCAVKLPGRETRINEAPFTRLSSLLAALAPALLPYLDRPFAFFGHSLGALIGFELARRIRNEYGFEAVHLFASGHRAPHLARARRPIHKLPDAQLIEELRQLNGTPPPILEHVELLRLVLPVLRADFSLCETYAYNNEPPLDCPISVFGGNQDGGVSSADLQAWQMHTAAGFQIDLFVGDHFFLHSSRIPLLGELSRQLSAIVQLAPRRRGYADGLDLNRVEYQSSAGARRQWPG